MNILKGVTHTQRGAGELKHKFDKKLGNEGGFIGNY